MTMTETTMLTPRRLQPGDRVRLLSPASPPDPEKVATGIRLLEGWGLRVEVGTHAFDRHGHFLAGKDEDRLPDWNEALRDPGVRAIFSTRGGKVPIESRMHSTSLPPGVIRNRGSGSAISPSCTWLCGITAGSPAFRDRTWLGTNGISAATLPTGSAGH